MEEIYLFLKITCDIFGVRKTLGNSESRYGRLGKQIGVWSCLAFIEEVPLLAPPYHPAPPFMAWSLGSRFVPS